MCGNSPEERVWRRGLPAPGRASAGSAPGRAPAGAQPGGPDQVHGVRAHEAAAGQVARGHEALKNSKLGNNISCEIASVKCWCCECFSWPK